MIETQNVTTYGCDPVNFAYTLIATVFQNDKPFWVSPALAEHRPMLLHCWGSVQYDRDRNLFLVTRPKVKTNSKGEKWKNDLASRF